MAIRFWFVPSALFFLSVAASGQPTTTPADARIVQPGPPGADSKILSPAKAAIQPRAPSEADTKFMQGMIHHHAQAVEMTALMRTRTHNKALLKLGERISISQTDEMQFMRQWLQDRGKQVPTDHSHMAHMDHSNMNMGSMAMGSMSMDMGSMPMMPGMLTPEQMKALAKASGSRFDYLFLTGMIQHHTGALTMVQELFDTPGAGQDNQLFDFATDVDNTQTAEINIMKGMLKEKK
jgi:uncharacterized protein (DUF305 family)